MLANPIIAALARRPPPTAIAARAAGKGTAVIEQKMYLYPDYLHPDVATNPDVYAAIRLGTLVHGPGATEMYQRAWHYDDGNSAVFACLSAIATAFPEAAPKVYLETEPGERDEQPDHPLKTLLDNPNPNLSREHMWGYIQWCQAHLRATPT